MAQKNGLLRDFSRKALYDVLKEGLKLMLPFLVGLGIRQWVNVHATALMWTAGIVVAAIIAFSDRIHSEKLAAQEPTTQAEIDELKRQIEGQKESFKLSDTENIAVKAALDSATARLANATKKNEDFERSIEAIGKNMEDLSKNHHALFMEKKNRDFLADLLWKLKRHAREIRRRWPNSDFTWYPAAKGLWATVPQGVPITLTDAGNNREWVVDALKWHEKFIDFVGKVGRDQAYVNSLDFDELMEFLDIEERIACGIPETSDPNAPVVIAEYAVIPGEYTKHGFNVSNINLRTAFDVRIVPLRFGKWRAFFADRLGTLDKTVGKEFVEMSAQEPGCSVLGPELFTLMNRWRTEADCWSFPVPLRIIYRDSGSNWFMSTFLLEQNAGGKGSQTIVCRARPHKLDERLSFIQA